MKGITSATNLPAGLAQGSAAPANDATSLSLAVDNSLAQDREKDGPEKFQKNHPDRCAYTHIELALLEE